MPVTPNITLTATLQDNSGTADAGASLRITLINPNPQALPRIAGTSMLAKIKQVIVSVDGSFSQKLWGNDQITPAGTFYEVAVLDDASNVVQAGMYRFTGGPLTIDLSAAVQLLSGLPYLTGAVPNGKFPGTEYALPTPATGGPVGAALYYNGGLQEPKWYSIDGLALILEFATTAGDSLYLQYATSVFGSGLPLTPWIAISNGVHPGVAFTVPTAPPNGQFAGLFLNDGFQNPSQYTLAGGNLTMNVPTSAGDVIQLLYLIGAPGVTGEAPAGAYPGTAYTVAAAPVGGELIALYNNSNFQRPGIDYEISGLDITMNYVTAAGDSLYAYYVHP